MIPRPAFVSGRDHFPFGFFFGAGFSGIGSTGAAEVLGRPGFFGGASPVPSASRAATACHASNRSGCAAASTRATRMKLATDSRHRCHGRHAEKQKRVRLALLGETAKRK